MRYITRRRLLHAAYVIQKGMDALEAAMLYGFDTYAGYYKAFCRECGCSLTRYLQTHRAATPVRVNLKEENKMPDKKQLEQVLEAWGLQNEKSEMFIIGIRAIAARILFLWARNSFSNAHPVWEI